MIEYPCSANEAVDRAGKTVASLAGQYLLGTGDYRPHGTDTPWTYQRAEKGSDCAGFAICYCWKLVRHRPGFNRGPWASVEDDINCNSLIEDAQHKQELCEEVNYPAPGDLLAYPSFALSGPDGTMHRFIGHVGLVIAALSRAWDPLHRRYDRLSIAQCHGPNGFKPGAVVTDGSIWLHHDSVWPKPEHRTHIIRMKERK